MTRHDPAQGRADSSVGTLPKATSPVRRAGPPSRPRHDWPAVVEEAATIVRSYETPVTLRQLFYRLVSIEVLPNTVGCYKALSRYTAQARREGTFPAMQDRGRGIECRPSWTSPSDALAAVANQYRRDRTDGQTFSIYMGVEKSGMLAQLTAWYGYRGLPLLALGGYSSQTLADDVRADVARQARPAVLLYGGDHDASGEDIDRDFVTRTGCWAEVVRVALTAEQVELYDLPPLPGKRTDSRAGAFARRHGGLVQVELDALAPDVLHRLYDDALAEWWDPDAHAQVLEVERGERQLLQRLAGEAVAW